MTRRRWLLGLAGLALLLGLLALALLATGTGTRVVLERIEAEFPGLTVGHADGRLSGTVVLDDVHWQGDGIEVSIRRLALVPRLRLLLGGTIAFASIDAEGLRVRSFARAAQHPTTRWASTCATGPSTSRRSRPASRRGWCT